MKPSELLLFMNTKDILVRTEHSGCRVSGLVVEHCLGQVTHSTGLGWCLILIKSLYSASLYLVYLNKFLVLYSGSVSLGFWLRHNSPQLITQIVHGQSWAW